MSGHARERAPRTERRAEIRPVDALAADGTIVHIRPQGPHDGPALRELHAATSVANLYLRFFTENRGSADAYVARLTGPEHDRGQVVLLAEQDGRLLGVACFEPTVAGEAEIAFLVDDRHHGLGLGTLLLEHLAAAARARGIHTFRADVLAVNRGMLQVFADSGFTERTTPGGSVTEITLDTALSGLTLTQMAFRQRQSSDLALRPSTPGASG